MNPALNTGGTVPAQAAGANSFTEDQARKQIADAGFNSVSALTKNASGLWQGEAMRGQETVNVSVDYRGGVTTSAEGSPEPRAAGQPEAGGSVALGADAQGTPASTVAPDAGYGATAAEIRRTGERG